MIADSAGTFSRQLEEVFSMGYEHSMCDKEFACECRKNIWADDTANRVAPIAALEIIRESSRRIRSCIDRTWRRSPLFQSPVLFGFANLKAA